jgi:hypothetical protein
MLFFQIRTLSDSDNDESVETECVSSKLNEENGKNTNVTIQKPKGKPKYLLFNFF